MKKIGIWAFLLLLGTATALSAKKDPKAIQRTAEAVTQRLEARDYRIAVTRVQPTGEAAFSPLPGYSVRVKDQTVTVQLPYVGQGYNVPFGGGKGLNFSSPITDYSEEPGKKGMTLIHLTTRNAEGGRVEIRLKVFPNARAYIQVDADGLGIISYTGAMEP